AHASGPERLPARAALLALVRARDPRALDLLPGLPDAPSLRAAATHFPAAGDRLVPVLRRELAAGATGSEIIALTDALAALGPAAIRAAEPELVECLRSGRGSIVSARVLGPYATRSAETESLLRTGMGHRDAKTRAASAVAHYRLTGDPAPALRVFEALLSSPGESPWHLDTLAGLGPVAAPLLPLVEPHLRESYEWTRVHAADAYLRLGGSPGRGLPVLAGVVAATPQGFHALRSLAELGPVPPSLRPALVEFATSPTRVLGPSPTDEIHPDVRLRALARTLLARMPG
ncbi:MAG: hypothetical protein HOY69_39285, partial [Streptomyces sp.]|nr:hypothetical protein [Streptomyces sp.]